MKRWIIAVFLSMLLAYPAALLLADGTPGSGGPGSSYPSSGYGKHRHSKNNKDEESAEKKKEKALLDKKVDDAIRKAWEEK